MPVTSKATTTWTGDLTDGSGAVEFVSSRIGTYPINWKARSKGADATTTPEELIAAAHASCFSMALSNALVALDTLQLDPASVSNTLGVLLKYQDDIQRMQGGEIDRILDSLRADGRLS